MFKKICISILYIFVILCITSCSTGDSTDEINKIITVEDITVSIEETGNSDLNENIYNFSQIEETENLTSANKDTTSDMTENPKQCGILEVHFIDVGQSDSTLIKYEGYNMLIDAGDIDSGVKIQNYLLKQDVDELDYLILTHPDSDHIGGAPVIITKFDIGYIYMSSYKKDSKPYEKTMQAIEYKNVKSETPIAGSEIFLGDCKVTFLGPVDTYEDPNNSSIALMIQNGENKFLFTGDAEEKAESDILSLGYNLKADVYKAGHHGSKSSSSAKFIEAVQPTYSVISCGEENSYGHPHAQTLNTLRQKGISVFRTDEQGSIIATSDGATITWNCSPSDTWKAGEPSKNADVTQHITDIQNVILQDEKMNCDDYYVLNINSMKYHLPNCGAVNDMSNKNKETSSMSKEELEKLGYVSCKMCNP